MISRRKFVTNVAATTAAVTIVPRHVLGRGFTAPSDRLNIAGIGVGGMGRTNLLNLGLDNNIVALCDVDWGHAGPQWTTDAFALGLENEEKRLLRTDLTPEARKNSEHRVGSLKRIAAEDLAKMKRYTDYRLMLEQQKDIDAFVVATPDHMHAPIAMAVLDLGKHVYVQKPLCW
jgi:predicted dehydrogenase